MVVVDRPALVVVVGCQSRVVVVRNRPPHHCYLSQTSGGPLPPLSVLLSVRLSVRGHALSLRHSLRAPQERPSVPRSAREEPFLR